MLFFFWSPRPGWTRRHPVLTGIAQLVAIAFCALVCYYAWTTPYQP